MSERKRPIQDLQAEVAAQLHLLKKAAHEFDAGDLLEVRNMARALRVLVAADDHGNAALIELAQMVAGPFLDTRTITHPKNLAPALELVGIILGPKTVGCRALLDDAPMSGTADFGTWLKQTVIDDKAGGIFNRLRLIKAVANVGGGTHYPPDIRTYFEKLQRLGVSASKRGQTVEQRFEDVEKHSIRQIAHEVLKTFDKGYVREGRFEGGALITTAQELILYPGRQAKMGSYVKQKPQPLIVLTPAAPHGFDGVSGPMIELPYESSRPNEPCPSLSGLRFRECCSEARNFDPSFIEGFERRHKLGAFLEHARR